MIRGIYAIIGLANVFLLFVFYRAGSSKKISLDLYGVFGKSTFVQASMVMFIVSIGLVLLVLVPYARNQLFGNFSISYRIMFLAPIVGYVLFVGLYLVSIFSRPL